MKCHEPTFDHHLPLDHQHLLNQSMKRVSSILVFYLRVISNIGSQQLDASDRERSLRYRCDSQDFLSVINKMATKLHLESK